jgi:hypothetical protein
VAIMLIPLANLLELFNQYWNPFMPLGTMIDKVTPHNNIIDGCIISQKGVKEGVTIKLSGGSIGRAWQLPALGVG